MDYDIQKVKDLVAQLVLTALDLGEELDVELPVIDVEEPPAPEKK